MLIIIIAPYIVMAEHYSFRISSGARLRGKGEREGGREGESETKRSIRHDSM